MYNPLTHRFALRLSNTLSGAYTAQLEDYKESVQNWSASVNYATQQILLPPDLQRCPIQKINTIIEDCTDAVGKLTFIAKRIDNIKPPKDHNYTDLLRGCCEVLHSPQVKINTETWSLDWQTPPVILYDPDEDEEHEIGPCIISITQYATVRVWPLEGRYEEEWHPHASGNHLCLGRYDTAIHQLIQQGHFTGAFMQVQAILNNYEPDAAYWKYSDDQYCCDECGRRITEVYTCQDCGAILCENCTTYCESCDRDFCYSHMTTCNDCGDYVCGNCATSCDNCGETLCPSCAENNSCEICGKGVCNDCRQTCNHCGVTLCNDCYDDGLCPECKEEQEEQNEEEEKERQEAAEEEEEAQQNEKNQPETIPGETNETNHHLHSDSVCQNPETVTAGYGSGSLWTVKDILTAPHS